MKISLSHRWPVVRTFDQPHLRKIAMPLGGIGTGSISLGGRGNLQDWEVMNRPAKGYDVCPAFFALWTRTPDGRAVTRCLEGGFDPVDYDREKSMLVWTYGLPRFQKAGFASAYPFGQVRMSDPAVPLHVRMEAFNPLIPGDAARSGIPLAIVRYVLINPTQEPVDAAVCGTLGNFVGNDGLHNLTKANHNTLEDAPGLRGVAFRSRGVPAEAEQAGSVALAVLTTSGVTRRTAWAGEQWNADLQDFWEDFSEDGKLEERQSPPSVTPIGSVAARIRLKPGEEKSLTFLISWHFPNRISWFPRKKRQQPHGNPPERLKNWYSTRYQDAWDVLKKTAPQLKSLEADSLRFVQAVADSDFPAAVKDAALSNLSTLRTQTCFRTEDGHFFGYEGCMSQKGSCPGSCTHVWNYEQSTSFLFGDLSRSMRTVEFAHATDKNGLMSFRAGLPLTHASTYKHAAADGQMGAVVRLYRDWKLSGDHTFLSKLWPAARKAMEFCWIPGGWDEDRDGVMEGCQHNTYDVEFYGPNPLMTSLYLAALRAAALMAEHQNEPDFAATCQSLFDQGSAKMDRELFNGAFYEQKVQGMAPNRIAPGLRAEMGARNPLTPTFQLGEGCLIDQLLGQYVAHQSGLGSLLNPGNKRAALKSILRYNALNSFSDFFNSFRTYAQGDEKGVLVCTYPKGSPPKHPFPYATEVWSGCEYALAALLVAEGMGRDAVQIMGHVRDRYDGRKRNPFDELECGHHYARAMSAWALIPALTGFIYDGETGVMTFTRSTRPALWFWSTGDSWGTVRQQSGRVSVKVLFGSLKLSEIRIGDSVVTLNGPRSFRSGQSVSGATGKSV